jgi:Flp pilus assembly protein TadG
MLKSVLMPRALRRLHRKASLVIRSFHRSHSGVAATEFALMVPAMLMIWVGMVVATDALTADKKVTLLTRTLADMTTQMQAVSQADMDSIFQATEAVLWPKSADAMGMRVTSYDIDGAGKVFVDWSVVPTNGALKGGYSAHARCASSTEVPAGLRIERTSIVLAEVSMKYQASIASQMVDELFKGSMSSGQLPLGDRLFMRARQSNKVQFNPAPAGTCPGFVT